MVTPARWLPTLDGVSLHARWVHPTRMASSRTEPFFRRSEGSPLQQDNEREPASHSFTHSTTIVIPRFRRPRSLSFLSSPFSRISFQLNSSDFDQFSPKMQATNCPASASSRNLFCTAMRISPPTPLDPYP